MANLRWNEGTATECDIVEHLQSCKPEFASRLAERVGLPDYVRKIHDNAVTFEAWHQQTLVGLVAGYLNDKSGSRVAFISSVSVVESFAGCGIATKLIQACHQRATDAGFLAVRLEVDKENLAALALYRKLGYTSMEDQGNMIMMEHPCGAGR